MRRARSRVYRGSDYEPNRGMRGRSGIVANSGRSGG